MTTQTFPTGPNKSIVLGVGAAVVVATSAVLFGGGVAAAAPNVIGLPYGDAVSVINESGGFAVVATRVGGKVRLDDCLVTNAWDGMFVRETSRGAFAPTNGEVLLALNCDVAASSPAETGSG